MQASIWIAAAACLLACYFAACHNALKIVSRKRLADVLEQRDRLDQLDPFLARLPKHLLVTGTLRTCLSLTVLLATLYGIEAWAPQWTQPRKFGVGFAVAGVLVTIFAVAIPLSWARHHRESLVALSMPVLRALLLLLLPLASLLHLFDPLIRRITGVHGGGETESELSDEVLTVVEDHERGQAVDDVQKEMLEAVFELPSTSAGEIMTPRTDVKGLDIGATLEQVKQAVIDYGHSRIPVYQESLDHIVGVLYAKDLIAYVGDGKTFDLRRILRDALIVPESKSVRELLAEFKARKVHMAIVLDEYGGTAGLVTIEDILEELVGEIQDEYEPVEEMPQLTRVNEATAEVDARMHIDDFNDEMQVELPEEDDYDTVGGFVFATLGHIPEAGEQFDFADLRFTVTDAERTKVKRVRVERVEPAPAHAQTNGT